MTQATQQGFQEHWQLQKPAVTGRGGIVATQHHLATDVGTRVLREGGNAVDAAVAAGFALGVVEPWMSGPGGGGYMCIYLAREDQVHVVEFGMRAPFAASSKDYPLAETGTNAADAFNWPGVKGDTNVEGPLSIAVPGYVRGVALALAEFGSKSWSEVLEPACQLAEWGLPVDWYVAAKINLFARNLQRNAEASRNFLPGGLAPAPDLNGDIYTLQLGELARTCRCLQKEGPDAFYTGSLSKLLVQDLQAAGSRINSADLAAYEARIGKPLSCRHQDALVQVSGHLTAGPSLVQALQLLAGKLAPRTDEPDTNAWRAMADSLLETYSYRLENLGEGKPGKGAEPGATSHLAVADKEGNLVSFTQTIMSGFGSRVMLPRTGIIMNNGMMWFDPRPGGPNSIEGGRHPLSNMCPTLVQLGDGSRLALGACGGRRIFPAVFQLISLMVDFRQGLNQAIHSPRLDVSGTDLVTLMDSMPESTARDLLQHYPNSQLRPCGVSPNLFALPQIVQRHADGRMSGGCFIPSPHAKTGVVQEV